MAVESIGYGMSAPETPIGPVKYQVRDPTPDDVLIEVLYCGICYADVHAFHGDMGPIKYPLIPGHELTGHVIKIGENVTKHKVGDRVAIGCMVGSCRQCETCRNDLENYCDKMILTYNAIDEHGDVTHGGYGTHVVAHQHYVLSLPDSLPMDHSAPLLCAGITVYSPIMATGMNKGGFKVGVIGLGGLGHMAVQFAVKMGNEVTVLSRSSGKEKMAKSLGATNFVTSDEEYKKLRQSLDFIIDTVPVKKAMDKYLNILKIDGTMVMVGVPSPKDPQILDVIGLIARRRRLMGSIIGGIKETQEMLQYCAENQILPVVEMVQCEEIPIALERLVNSEVKFRFVIDVKGTQLSL